MTKALDNTLKILELINKDVPVAKGALKPLIRKYSDLAEFLKDTCFDTLNLCAASKKETELSAVQFIAEIVQESDKKITLVTTGSLTNIATFILSYPHLLYKIKQICITGGCSIGPDKTTAAELNIWDDQEAAEIVFNSNIPIIMHGLDVTHKAFICHEDIKRFKNSGNRVAVFTAELIEHMYKEKNVDALPLPYACTVAWLIGRSIFTSSKHFVQIDTLDEYTQGATIVDCRGFGPAVPNAEVVFDIDRQKFVDMLYEACQKYN